MLRFGLITVQAALAAAAAFSLGTGTLVCGAEPAERAAVDRVIDFARDVEPILAEHCYGCHGPAKRESNYRLDRRDVATAGGDFGEPAIVPGDSDASPLVQYVSGDGDIVMPPEGPPLDDAAVAILRAWVDQGAVWPDDRAGGHADALTTDHWSFQPLQRPQPPQIDDPWVANPIDAFIAARLAEADLSPSPAGDRATLIRRLYLDMHGLPPTPEEIDTFAADEGPTAYARLVERVLASPHYGERWARHWLDVVRFAETNGFETNTPRPTAWHYRDWVIESLNADLPYDRFVMHQLAGDAMGADRATGFLVGGPYDTVKSPDVALTLMQRQDELADIVNTTGTALLGLTLGCARCHNHKFDPVLQEDYYSLQAIFAGVKHGERPLPRGDEEQRRQQAAAIRAEIASVDRAVDNLEPLARVDENAPNPVRPRVNSRRNVDRFAPVEFRFLRFVALATTANFEPCIDELEVYSAEEPQRNLALAAPGISLTSSGDYPGNTKHQLVHLNDGSYGNDRSWISNTAGTGWAQIEWPQPVVADRVVWGRDRQEEFSDRLATDYRIEVALVPGAWQIVAASADRVPYESAASSEGETEEGSRAAARSELLARREKLIDALTTLEQGQRVYAGVFEQPETTHRLYRGDPMAPREPVAPDALQVISRLGLSDETPDQQRRLKLAEWIASPDNPLTARVMANRIWHYHFGTGLVDTPSDFGASGGVPSHPELLDWLACELIDSGWSLKHLHRLILLSATYQQHSTPHEAGLAVDAQTRLLWRFPPRRLEAEAIRDCMLAVTGKLDSRMGGAGFSFFEPNDNYVRVYEPKQSFGPEEWRRMIYATVVRMERDAVFGAFDAPDAGQVCPRRPRSTTPLQALNLLNSPFVLRQAELLAERLRREAGEESTAQVRRAFALALGRAPDDQELARSRSVVEQHGLETFCRAVLNLNEFLFVP